MMSSSSVTPNRRCRRVRNLLGTSPSSTENVDRPRRRTLPLSAPDWLLDSSSVFGWILIAPTVETRFQSKRWRRVYIKQNEERVTRRTPSTRVPERCITVRGDPNGLGEGKKRAPRSYATPSRPTAVSDVAIKRTRSAFLRLWVWTHCRVPSQFSAGREKFF